MTRAKDISKIVTDANLSGTLDVTGAVTAGGIDSTCAAGDGNLALQAYHPTSTSARDIAKFQSNVGGTQVDQMVIGCDGNVDINGTVTADGANISGGTDSVGELIISQGNASTKVSKIVGTDTGGTNERGIDFNTFYYADYKRMRISAEGNISFYEDTGTTPKLFWNASAERLGIGTSSPQKRLDITDSSSGESIPILISNRDVTAGTGQKVTLGFGLSRNSGAFKPEAGTIEVGRELDWTNDDANIDSYMAFSTYLNNAATEKMRIDSSGNVGIGGTIDNHGGYARVLQITGAGESAIELENSSGYGYLAMNGTNMQLKNVANGNMLFYTNNTERMRITSAGHILINTSGKISADQGQGFAVHANTSSAGSCMEVKNTGNPASNRDFIRFYNTSNGEAGSIEHNGTSSVAYLTSSDYRLKENVVTNWDATTRLKQLKPSRFNFIADADRTVDGFLAHEVQAIVPEAISGAKDEVDADGNPVYQGIDQSKLVPLLVKTIQELEARIVALETA